MVQFDIPGKLDHTVCVDGRRRVVWDNGKECPLELNPNSLRLCRGVKKRIKSVTVCVREMVKKFEKKEVKKTEVIELD